MLFSAGRGLIGRCFDLEWRGDESGDIELVVRIFGLLARGMQLSRREIRRRLKPPTPNDGAEGT